MSNQHLAEQRRKYLFLKTVPIKPLGLASVETSGEWEILLVIHESLQVFRGSANNQICDTLIEIRLWGQLVLLMMCHVHSLLPSHILA